MKVLVPHPEAGPEFWVPRRMTFSVRNISFTLMAVLSAGLLYGQSDSLTLSSGVSAPGGTVTLNLSLSIPAGQQPAGMQWTFTYPAAAIASASTVTGAAATAAGKSVLCNGSSGIYTCLVSGTNSSPISGGVIASITFSGVASSTAISLSSVSGVDATGTAMTISGTGGAISVSGGGPALSSLNCSPASVTGGASVSCTVGLTAAAPSGGASVGLSSNNSAVAVPQTVAVPAGSTAATFTATTSSVSTSQSVAVGAAYGGGSATALLSVLPSTGPNVSSLQCNPTTVTGGASSVCSVGLSSAVVSTDGAGINLASSNSTVSVPAVLRVPTGATSATFTATTSAVASNQSATITAAYGTGSATATISVVTASGGISALQCAPNNMTGGARSNCTVTLPAAAPTGGAAISLASNNSAVSLTSSIMIAAGSTSGTFTANSVAVSTDQSAMITATLSGSSKSASIAVDAPVPSGLTCSPGTVVGGVSSSCTVTLTGVAPAAGVSVALSSNNTMAVVPAHISIAGSSSATFSTSTASVETSQAATITASYNSATASASLNIVPTSSTQSLTGLTCTLPGPSTTLAGGYQANCSVVLSAAATNALTVTLQSSSTVLSVPASVSVPAGSSTAAFAALAGAVTASQNATITASAGGVSKTATLPMSPLSFTEACGPKEIVSGATVTCTITLPYALPAANHAISFTIANSNSAVLSIVSAVSINGGSATTTFTGTARSGYGIATITATGEGVSKAASVAVGIPPVRSVSCSPSTLGAGGTSTCTLTLSTPAPPVTTPFVGITSSNRFLTVPSALSVPVGSTTASFSATAASNFKSSGVVTVSSGGATASVTINYAPSLLNKPPQTTSASGDPSGGITSVRPSSLTCSPRLARAGDVVFCEVQLSSSDTSEPMQLTVTASDPSVKTPSRVFTRAGQSTLSFQVAVGAPKDSHTTNIAVSLNGEAAQDFIAVQGATAGSNPAASAPQPAPTSKTGASPVIERIVHAATGSSAAVCTAGSLASVYGDGLADGSAVDGTGSNSVLAGAKVNVNGNYASMVYASPNQITFVCPDVQPAMAISIETATGRSKPFQIRPVAAAPGIFTLDGSGHGQAAASIVDGSLVAMARSYIVDAEPAQPGDVLRIPVTGLGAGADPASLSVRIGNLRVPVDEIQPAQGMVGVEQVAIKVPFAVSFDDAAPILIERSMPDGTVVSSQPVTIATEPVRK